MALVSIIQDKIQRNIFQSQVIWFKKKKNPPLPNRAPLSFVTLEFLPTEVISEDRALKIMFPSPQCFL